MADDIANISIGVTVDQGSLSRAEKQITSALASIERLSSSGGTLTRSFSQPLGVISGQLSQFEKSLEASNARVIAFGASAGAIYQLSAALKSVISSTIEVEKELANLNSILNVGEKDLRSFGDSLFDIAKKTGQSFQDVAKAATEFSRQGLGVEKTLKRTRDALILSRLTGLDVVSSTEALTAAINSFNDAAVDSTSIINKLANVDAQFAVSSADLAEAIKRVGNSAVDAGLGIDELIATVTVAQQKTARGGAVIGNSLKTIFTRIQRTDTLDQLQALGVSVQDSQGKMLPAIKVLQNFSQAYDKLGQSQKSAAAELLGGVFQINILKAVVSDLGSSFSEYDRALKISSNSNDEAIIRSEKLNKTLFALLNETTINLKKFGSDVGGLTIAPAIREIFEDINSVIDALTVKDKDSIGGKLASGILNGLGKVLSGPGLVLITTVLGKIAANFATFGVDAFKTFLGMNAQAQKQAEIQQLIQEILLKNPSLITAATSSAEAQLLIERELLNVVKARNVAIEQSYILSKKFSSGALALVSSPAAKGGKTQARGFVPNFANGASQEVLGALAGGYAPGSIKQMNINGVGKVTYNSAEQVKHVPGFNQPFINPPSGSKAGMEHRRKSIRQTGIDPYASGGFVPNFKQSTSYGSDVRTVASLIEGRGGSGTAYNRLKVGGNVHRGDRIEAPDIEIVQLGEEFDALIAKKDKGLKEVHEATRQIEEKVANKYGGVLTASKDAQGNFLAKYGPSAAVDVLGKDFLAEVKSGGFDIKKVREKFQRFPIENPSNSYFTPFTPGLDKIQLKNKKKAILFAGDISKKKGAASGFIPNFAPAVGGNFYDFDETIVKYPHDINPRELYFPESVSKASLTPLGKKLVGSKNPINVLTAREINSRQAIEDFLRKSNIPVNKVLTSGSMFRDIKTQGARGPRALNSSEKKAEFLKRATRKFGTSANLIDDAKANIDAVRALNDPNITGELYRMAGQRGLGQSFSFSAARKGLAAKFGGFVPNFSNFSLPYGNFKNAKARAKQEFPNLEGEELNRQALLNEMRTGSLLGGLRAKAFRRITNDPDPYLFNYAKAEKEKSKSYLEASEIAKKELQDSIRKVEGGKISTSYNAANKESVFQLLASSGFIPNFANIGFRGQSTLPYNHNMMKDSILVQSGAFGGVSPTAQSREEIIKQVESAAGRLLTTGELRYLNHPKTTIDMLKSLSEKRKLESFLNSEERSGFAQIPFYSKGFIPNFSLADIPKSKSKKANLAAKFAAVLPGLGNVKPEAFILPLNAFPIHEGDQGLSFEEKYESMLYRNGLSSLGFNSIVDLNKEFHKSYRADFFARNASGIPYVLDAKSGNTDAKERPIFQKLESFGKLFQEAQFQDFAKKHGVQNLSDIRTGIVFRNATPEQRETLDKQGIFSNQLTPKIDRTSKSFQEAQAAFEANYLKEWAKADERKARTLANKKRKEEAAVAMASGFIPNFAGYMSTSRGIQRANRQQSLDRAMTEGIKKTGRYRLAIGSKDYIPEIMSVLQTHGITGIKAVERGIDFSNIEAALPGLKLIAQKYSLDPFGKIGYTISQERVREIESLVAKSKVGQLSSAGFVPSFFAHALNEAISRENAAGIPMGNIKVGSDRSLISPQNPSGLGVFNTLQEKNLKQGIAFARQAGINPKTKGASGGLIPNFADEGLGAASASFDIVALSLVFGQLKDSFKGVAKAAEDAKRAKLEEMVAEQTLIKDKVIATKKDIRDSSSALAKVNAQIATEVKAGGTVSQSLRDEFSKLQSKIKESNTALTGFKTHLATAQASAAAFAAAPAAPLSTKDKIKGFLGGGGLTSAAIFAPLITEQISALIPETSKGAIQAKAASSGLGGIISSAGTGATVGAAFGPQAALALGAGGALVGLFGAITDVSNASVKYAEVLRTKQLEAIDVNIKKLDGAGQSLNALGNAFEERFSADSSKDKIKAQVKINEQIKQLIASGYKIDIKQEDFKNIDTLKTKLSELFQEIGKQSKVLAAERTLRDVAPQLEKLKGKTLSDPGEAEALRSMGEAAINTPAGFFGIGYKFDYDIRAHYIEKQDKEILDFYNLNKAAIVDAFETLTPDKAKDILGDKFSKNKAIFDKILAEIDKRKKSAEKAKKITDEGTEKIDRQQNSIFRTLNDFNRNILRSFQEFKIKGEIESAAEKAANEFRTELENGISKIVEPFTSKESLAAFQADVQKSQIGRDIKFKREDVLRKGVGSGQGILESISKAIQSDIGGKGPIQSSEAAKEVTDILDSFRIGLEESNFEKAADSVIKLEGAVNRVNSPFKDAGKAIGDVSEQLRTVIRDTQAGIASADKEHEERIKLLNLQTEIQKIILKNQKDIAFGGGLEAALDPLKRLQDISKIQSGIAFGGAAGDKFAQGRGFLELSKVLATFGQPGAFQAPLIATAKQGLDELISKFAPEFNRPEFKGLIDTNEIAKKQIEAALQPDKAQEDLRKLLQEYADKLGETISKSPLIKSQDSLKKSIEDLDKSIRDQKPSLPSDAISNGRFLPTISGEVLPAKDFSPKTDSSSFFKPKVNSLSPFSKPKAKDLGFDFGSFFEPKVGSPGLDLSSVFESQIGSPGLNLSSVFGPNLRSVLPGERMIGPSEAPEEYVINEEIKKKAARDSAEATKKAAEEKAVADAKAVKKAADFAAAMKLIEERMEKVSGLVKAGDFGEALSVGLDAIDVKAARIKKINTAREDFENVLGEFKVADLGLNVQGAVDEFDTASKLYDAKLITQAEYQNRLTAATSKLNAELAKINFKKGAIFAEELRQIIAATNEAKIKRGEFGAGDLLESIKGEFSYGLPDAFKATDEAIRHAATSFRDGTTDALFEAIKGTKDLRSAFSDLFANIADDLLKSGLRMAMNSLFNSVGGQGGLLSNIFNKGGLVKGYSTGGTVTGGSGLRDDVPAYLSKGEYVVRKAAVDKYGLDYLNSLNSGRTIGRQEGGAAIFRGANEFLYNDPKRPTGGRLSVDERLSIAALTDEDNPQNRTRQERQDRLQNYLADKAEHDRQQAEVLAQFKKQKRARSIGALVNAGVSIGAFAIAQKIGDYNQTRADDKLAAKERALRSVSGNLGPIRPFYRPGGAPAYAPGYARGGSINDDVPALLTSGEYVMRKDAVDKYGLNFFNRLNSGAARGYAEGGLVGDTAPLGGASAGGANNISITVNVNNNGTSAVKAEGGAVNNKDAKALADSINNAVIKTIIDQKKPGGLLYR